MGFLRRLRSDDGPPRVDTAPVLALLSEHALPALDQQLHLQDLIGDADWLLDQDAGTIRFGDELSCAAQILGTATDRPKVWRWAWANESVSAAMSADARTVLSFGERFAIAAFTQPDVRLDDTLAAEDFTLVAARLVGADAYYRGPYPGGAAYILLRFPVEVPRPLAGDGLRALRTLSTAPLALTIPIERGAIERYLAWVGLQVESTEDRSIARDGRGDTVTITYDDQGRFGGLETTLHP